MSDKIGISICGVGGKTTSTAMLATVLEKAGKQPSYFIGVGDIPSLQSPGAWKKRWEIFYCRSR